MLREHADAGGYEQCGGEGRRVEPRALRPKQAALPAQRDAGVCFGFGGADGIIKMAVGALLGQLAVAAGFALIVVKVQHAAGLPIRAVGQKVFEQSAAVAVAAEQEAGLQGGVGGDFGVEQALPIAGGGAGGLIVLFEYQAADAASGEGVGGGRAGNAAADNQYAFHRDGWRGNLPGFAWASLLRHRRTVLPNQFAEAVLCQPGGRGGGQQINITL